VEGEAPNPDLTLETSWADWIDMSVCGGDPRRAMLRRKLRPRGSLRMLWRMQRIFPRAG
jgi:putative sterol carrier protein